ncbi:MAG: CapA family protein [Eubacterium sp.]|nr:CapA family protein [Eubacterium sp.]
MSREDDKNIQRAELARRREAKRLERERQIRQMKIKLVICMVLFVLIVVGITMLIVREATKKKDTDSKAKAIAAEAVDSDESGRKISDWSSVGSAGDASLGTAGDALTDFEIDMSFVGDCCMASNLENNSYGTLLWYESNADTTYFFDGVRSYFENDDITVANCENTFSDMAIAPRDKGDEVQNFWFKSPAWFAKVFSDNSIEAVTINNNHTNDYGPEVFEDTKAALDAAGVEWGFRDKIIYYEEQGFKVGIVCVSYYSYSEAEGILPYLELAKENSDFQVIFFHGGVEGAYTEEDWKVQACHMLVDNGADLIVGAHPHVLQKRENYNGVDIVYSLGNFCFGGNDNPASNRTIIYKYKLKVHVSGEDREVTAKEEEMIPCYVYTGSTNNWQPYPIEEQDIADRVIKYMNGEIDSPN